MLLISVPGASAKAAPSDVAQPQSAILVVDDSPANLVSIDAVLRPLGQKVVMAKSGDEALARGQEQDFAVALLDVHMRPMNGFELAAAMRSQPRSAHVPIIFVTGEIGDSRQLFAGYAHGAVDYLVKPFEPEVLRAKVKVFLELHRKQVQIHVQAARLLELELRELDARNTERLRTLTESIPLPLWSVTGDGTVRLCNAAWTEYSGMTAEHTGMLFRPGAVDPRDVTEAIARWEEGIRRNVPFEIQCRLRRKRDGALRWYQLRAVPERGDGAHNGSWIVAGVDIDAQRTAEDERARLLEREQRAREEAEAANRMKDEFLATISHELRTPLNAILGWVRMIRSGMLDLGRLPQAMETIERSAQAQARLVADILDVSRIVSGKLRLQLGPIHLPTIVGEAVETIQPAAQAKNIELRWAPPAWDICMRGDASRLQQIVWNLASNAVKFTPKGGAVEICLERQGDGARISVKDTGPGISPEFLPFVFDRFRQGNASTSRPHEGLGLGLSIVKHLVELHGGSVAVQSAGAGAGAEFTVLLPLAEMKGGGDTGVPDFAAFGSPERLGRGRARLPRLSGVKILFVDDHPEARALAEAFFTRCGAQVVTAETAEQALRAMETSVPDVLISDIGLPGEDGYALIRRVRALAPQAGGNVPAIALTAFARPEDVRRARHEGFHVHMAKPVAPDELGELVSNLAARKVRRDGKSASGPRRR